MRKVLDEITRRSNQAMQPNRWPAYGLAPHYENTSFQFALALASGG
jgi:hypothetical protein